LRPIFRVLWISNPSKSCSTSYAINSTHLSNNLTETRAVLNQTKNNVTSRVRLDEKYVERRAVQEQAQQPSTFARVFGVFLQRDARLESSLPVRTLSQATNSTTRTLSPETNSKKGKPSQTTKTQHHTKITAAKAQQPQPVCAPSTPAHSKRGF
jgi:hypothetical protein